MAQATGAADRDQPSRLYRLNRTLTAQRGRAMPTESSHHTPSRLCAPDPVAGVPWSETCDGYRPGSAKTE